MGTGLFVAHDHSIHPATSLYGIKNGNVMDTGNAENMSNPETRKHLIDSFAAADL